MAVDPSAHIAATARVHPDAVIGGGVRVGEYAIVEQDVVIGAGSHLEPYVFVKRWTTLGERNQVSAGTVLGSDPLDKNFTGERSYLRIGNGNVIREHFTISRGTKPESETVIGDENYIMTAGHIAHNCRIGNRAVIASCALIAGYVEVGDQAFVSGGVAVHQFSKIGRLAMIAGMSRVNLDCPPFFVYMGYKMQPSGVNVIGLRRAGFPGEEIAATRSAYKLLYRSHLRLEESLARMDAELPSDAVREIASFIRSSRRGICRERGSSEHARGE